MSCNICRALGDAISWGNGCDSPHPPTEAEQLIERGQDLRECPKCGTQYRYGIQYEHAPDHYMPDRVETLLRIR